MGGEGTIALDLERPCGKHGRLLASGAAFPSKATPRKLRLEPDGTEWADVSEFTGRHAIRGALQKALELAMEQFSRADRWGLRVIHDPEEEDCWIAIDVWVRSSVEEFISEYDRYTARFVDAVPPEMQPLIRLCYHVE